MKRIYTLAFMLLFSSQIWAQIISNDCAVPTAITTNSLYGTIASFSWSGESPTHYFNYSYKKVSDTEWQTMYVKSNSIELTDLTPLTDYVIKIQTSCALNKLREDSIVSNWTAEYAFTTLDESVVKECIPPTNFTITDITSTTALLTYTSNFEVPLYYITTDTNSNLTDDYAFDNPQIIENLTPNTVYYISLFNLCNTVYDEVNEEYIDTYSDRTKFMTFTTSEEGTVGIKTNEMNINVFNANKQINIVNKENLKINEVVVMNMMGQEAARYSVNKSGNVVINANLPEANYIVKVIANRKINTYKMFVK